MARDLLRTLCCLAFFGSMALAGQPRPPAPKPDVRPATEAPLQTTSTTHFDVAFTVPPALGKGYVALCERAYGRFCELLNVPEGEAVWEGRCKVFLFGTREGFVQFAAKVAGPSVALSGGFARPTRREPLIALPMFGQERVRLEQVLIHEMSHVFLQLYRKEVNLPTWLQEGAAQFFEFMHHPGDSRLKQSKALAKVLVRVGQARPLREFWVKPFPPTDRAGYALAWSLIHCLSQNAKTKGKIGKFVLKLKELAPERKGFIHILSEADLKQVVQEAADKAFQIQADAFQQVFGMTPDDFEQAWRTFVLTSY